MKYIKLIPWIIASVALCAAIWAWYHQKVVQLPGTVLTLPGRTIWKIKDCTLIPPKGVDIVSNNTITLVQNDLPKCPEGGKLVTLLTPSTGEITNKFEPYDKPFWSFENEKKVKFVTNGNGGIFQADWTFARIGNFYLSGDAIVYSISGYSGFYTGIGLAYKF